MKNRLGLSLLLVSTLALGNLSADVVKKEASKEVKSVQNKVELKAKDSLKSKQKEMLKEALESLKDTHIALKALDENKTKKAEDLLAKVTGKLDLLMAKDPAMTLLPVAVSEKKLDVIVDKETIKSILFDANKALKAGRVQEARYLLKDLASEIVISTTSIPLATYPEAIKSIAPLIDAGKIDEAKATLEATLNSLVVSQQVIALPILRASLMLKQAEKLAEKKKRHKEESQELTLLLKEAKYQLEMAELLGYGTQKEYQPIYDEIAKIKEKSSDNKGGKGWFTKLKEKMKHLAK